MSDVQHVFMAVAVCEVRRLYITDRLVAKSYLLY